MHGQGDATRRGLYGPDDLMWQVNREAALLLAGPRALLMQLAHPLVAAGVAEHSHFEDHPIGRLRRTLDAMLGIIFGRHEEARSRAEQVNRRHETIEGRLAHATTHFAAGTPYRALDPDLLLWVQATLIDSARVGYECFVRPLATSERARLYAESKRMAPLFRLPKADLPENAAAFEAWMGAMLASPTLEITAQARELADAVLHPPLRWLPRAVGSAGSIVTLGLLPGTLRERYGFAWGRLQQRAFRAACAAIRGGRPWLPTPLRHMPHSRRGEQDGGRWLRC